MKPRIECPNGHPYTAENTYTSPDNRRRCRTCRNQRDRNRDRRTTNLPTNQAKAIGRALGAAASAAAAARRREAVLEDVQFMLANREHPDWIAARVGYKRTALARFMYRNGHPELARIFDNDKELTA